MIEKFTFEKFKLNVELIESFDQITETTKIKKFIKKNDSFNVNYANH